jgi:hypothetical protein
MATAPLRAFAFIVQAEQVALSVHRDLNTLLSTWGDALTADHSSSMLLHVGFDRPNTELVSEVLKPWRGRVLLTESARWVVPSVFNVSSVPVGLVIIPSHGEPLPVYLGLTGWGYPMEASEDLAIVSATVQDPWLQALADDHQSEYDVLRRLGIMSDQQYVQRRSEVPVPLRDEIDDFRFAYLLEATDRSNPFALLRIAPDWLLHFPISCFDDLPLRARNAFRKVGIEAVGEIGGLSEEYVLGIENFGRRSYETLAPAIINIALRKPYQHLDYSRDQDITLPHQAREALSISSPASTLEQVQYRTLWSGVQSVFDQMTPRDRIVLEGRLGWNEAPKTLDILGNILGVSRERARQIEARGLQTLGEKSWSLELTRRLKLRFVARSEPLFLDLLAAEDSWFQGFEDHIPFLGRIFERLHEGVYWAWPLNGRLVLARLSESDWDELHRSTRTALSAQAGAGHSEADVRLFIEATASLAGCPELANSLTVALWDELQFARHRELGIPTLVGVGRSIRAAVAAIMEEADQAIDIRAIATGCAERIGETPSDMAIRAALKAVNAYPFSGRRYALERHIGLSTADIEELLATLEQLLATGPVAKQWHCTELLESLRDEQSDLPMHVDQYVINIILQRSEHATYLGRFIWVSKTSSASSTRDRLDLADLTVVVLRRAGRPLSTAALKAAISDVRGLNAIFQVFPSNEVARVDMGLWGLVDRDFGMNSVERKQVLDQLEQVLQARNKGLHVSEIKDALFRQNWVVSNSVTNEMIFGLCQTDDRFRIAVGQLLGLVYWTSFNRLTVRGAVRKAVQDLGEVILPAPLYQRIDELAERKVDASVVHGELKLLGFVYDDQLNGWIRGNETGEAEGFYDEE